MTKIYHNLLRLNTSSYQNENFHSFEEQMAQELSLSYQNKDHRSQILITNTHTELDKIDPQIIDKTCLMIHPNSGWDNFSIDFVEKAPFPIIVGNSIRAHAVANYALSCVFHSTNNIAFQNTWDKARNWDRRPLIQRNILIVGKGHIGKLLEASLKGLTKSIHFYDPYQNETTPLNDLIKQADIIILACGLNDSSKYLISKNQFELMKPNTIIINPARGQLMVEKELIFFLKNNPNVKAYLDVFEEEPAQFEKFYELKNIFLTSHIAGVFKGLDSAIIDFEKMILESFIISPQSFAKKFQPLILQNKIKKGILI